MLSLSSVTTQQPLHEQFVAEIKFEHVALQVPALSVAARPTHRTLPQRPQNWLLLLPLDQASCPYGGESLTNSMHLYPHSRHATVFVPYTTQL